MNDDSPPDGIPFLSQVYNSSGYRCRNLILHPDRRLLGDGGKMGCKRWEIRGECLVFFDNPGRARFVFHRSSEGNWRSENVGVEMAEALGLDPDRLFLATREHSLVPQSLPAKAAFEIVVAKYREDLSWTEGLQANTTIYSKFSPDKENYIPLRNLGREGGTYLHHIVTRYETLAERTLFAQGDPFFHPLRPLEEYGRAQEHFWAAKACSTEMNWTMPWSSASQRITPEVLREFLQLLESDSSIERFHWTQGAQFALSRAQIQRRPLRYYQRLFDLTQQQWLPLAGRNFDNHHVAWLFELFWRAVFLIHDEGG